MRPTPIINVRLIGERCVEGLTQDECAFACAVGLRTFQRWTRGDATPTHAQLQPLWRLGIDVQWVIYGVRTSHETLDAITAHECLNHARRQEAIAA